MESIRHGVSVPRNKLLFNHGINLLPYTGAGSGITRALQFTPDIKFVNDEMLKEFVVTVKRKNVEDDVEVGDRDERDKKLADNKLEESTSTLTDGDDRDKNVEDNVKVSHQQSRIPYKLLSGIQKDIIQFCSIARTYKEILAHIGYKYNSKYMPTHIKPLIDMGYLELTIPDKPAQPTNPVGRWCTDANPKTCC